MRTSLRMFGFMAVVAAPCFGLSWGTEGHKIVALIAESKLNSHARAEVRTLLNSLGADSLADVALWLDDIRNIPSHPFNDQFRKNQGWHYANLPYGVTSYNLGDLGTNSEDAVQTVSRLANVLMGHGSSVDPSRRDALRALVHVVGDLHQPLHSGCGYFTLAGNGTLTVHPQATFSTGATYDRGANGLTFGGQKLHSFWDTPMVLAVMNGRTINGTAAALASWLARAGTTGSMASWPEQWCAESARVSNRIYGNIRYTTGWIEDGYVHAKITLYPNQAKFKKNFKSAASKQLWLAGNRLAQVLNEIWP